MKVLILEDDPLYGATIRRYLDGLASEPVKLVSTWQEAMKELPQKPDLMWIDLIVPGYDTESSILKVKEVRAANEEATLLVVSGSAESDIERRTREAGADAYANKMDAVNLKQVIALIMLALLHAKIRGASTEQFLVRAQQFLSENTKTQ